MRALVIGGDGKIGSALAMRLMRQSISVNWTTRRVKGGHIFYLDLLEIPYDLPIQAGDTVYLAASITGFQGATRPEAYAVNVDAQIRIVELSISAGAFPVFLSSDAIEYECGAAYAMQKSAVEAYMRHVNSAIVRLTRLAENRVDEFCDFLIEVGARREKGVFRWK